MKKCGRNLAQDSERRSQRGGKGHEGCCPSRGTRRPGRRDGCTRSCLFFLRTSFNESQWPATGPQHASTPCPATTARLPQALAQTTTTISRRRLHRAAHCNFLLARAASGSSAQRPGAPFLSLGLSVLALRWIRDLLRAGGVCEEISTSKLQSGGSGPK